jgi:hypothetical protein
MLTFEGHAIVSADGMIANAAGLYPPELRNDADWANDQRALDRAVVVVTGRRGHERHANRRGRRRLVLTHRVQRLGEDPNDPRATYWNPVALPLRAALAEIGITDGIVAITGVFDPFLPDYDSFLLSEQHNLLLPGGTPCFSVGHPRTILPHIGLKPIRTEIIDPVAVVTTTLWTR